MAMTAADDAALEDFSLSDDDDHNGNDNNETLDRAMMNELLLVCSNLGMLRVVDDGAAPVLMRGEDCTEWVHDLQHAIRRDHAKHKLVAKQLGKWKILQKKLLPLVVNHQHDWKLVFSILKVLVMLTMKPPRDSTNIAQQLKYLRDYKHAFLRQGVIPILMAILVEPLAKKNTARTDQDYLSMELVLTLLRNLLAIPNEDARFVTASSSHLSHLQQDLIQTLYDENVYEMVLLFAQDIDSAENREWNLLVMEMLDLTLGCSTPKAVAAFLKQQLSGVQTSPSTAQQPQVSQTHAPAARGDTSLVHALNSEKKLTKPRKPLGSQRHSNFGGMMKLVGSTGHSTVLTSFSKLGDEQVPQAAKKPVTRKRGGRGSSQPPITQTMDVIEIFAPRQSVTESDHATMMILVEICDTVLDKSYFQLTNSLKGEFRRGSSKLVSTDRLQYFHLIWFLTTYHRLKIQALKSIHRHNMKAYEKEKQALMAALDFDTPPPNEPTKPELNEKAVLSTLDMFSFNFVLQSIETYATGKNYHGMTVSVKLLAEMMTYISELANSDDVRFQRVADSLQHKIFYERDFLDRLPVLLKTWSPGTFSMEYVVDVITLTHIVFKILDAQGTIKVLSRRKAQMDEKRKQKKKKQDGQDSAGGDGDDDDDDSGDEEEAERQAQLLLEMQRKEADFDVRRYFQSVLSFDTIKMYCHALANYRTNSPKVNHYIHSFFYRAKHFRIHKDQEWTMQPMLFNIHVLLLFNKMLQDPLMQKHEYKSFLDFIKGVVCDFFTLADKNRMLFVEALLRHTYAAKSCLLMQRSYESVDSLTRSRAEAVALGRQEKLDRISEARRQKRALDAEDLDGEAEFTFTLNPTDFQASSLVASSSNESGAAKRAGDDDDGEAEFDDAVAPSPATSRPKRRSQAATDRAKNWTKVEDRFLKKVYLQYRHLPSVYEVISYEDMFQDRDRTPEQIERRVKYLKLHKLTHDSSGEEDNVEDKDGESSAAARSANDNQDEDEEEFGVGAFRHDAGMEETRLPKGLDLDDSDDDGDRGSKSRLGRRRRLRRAAGDDDEDSDEDLFAVGAPSSSIAVTHDEEGASNGDSHMTDAAGSSDAMGDTMLFPESAPTYLSYNASTSTSYNANDIDMPLSTPPPQDEEERDVAGSTGTDVGENKRKRPRDSEDEEMNGAAEMSPSKKVAREDTTPADMVIQPLSTAMEDTQVIEDEIGLEAEL